MSHDQSHSSHVCSESGQKMGSDLSSKPYEVSNHENQHVSDLESIQKAEKSILKARISDHESVRLSEDSVSDLYVGGSSDESDNGFEGGMSENEL